MIDGYSCWAAAINAAINSGDDLRIAVGEPREVHLSASVEF
ncbi:hypothetical protein QM298_05220 [Pseudomonas mendocina]|nr:MULTISPECIES: hypothetical protein [Pseudomonas]MDM9650559.1 hypothetical protein [Pseudomonas wenzhouensis]MDV5860369.1 hypothetical protein [Pseudomonas mendocina]WGL62397.1 hypothetical protein QDX81_15590 [Pseudomonas sp. CW003PS]